MEKEPGFLKLLAWRCFLPFYALWAVAATVGGFFIGIIPSLLIRWGMALSDRGVRWPSA